MQRLAKFLILMFVLCLGLYFVLREPTPAPPSTFEPVELPDVADRPS